MKLNDPLCSACPNKIIHYSYKDHNGNHQDKEIPCPNLCLPMTWVNGRAARKENLLEDPDQEERKQRRDYNDVLANLIERRQENHIEKIRDIDDIMIRAIACMLWADISVIEISSITHIKKDTLYKRMARYKNKINDV